MPNVLTTSLSYQRICHVNGGDISKQRTRSCDIQNLDCLYNLQQLAVSEGHSSLFASNL